MKDFFLKEYARVIAVRGSFAQDSPERKRIDEEFEFLSKRKSFPYLVYLSALIKKICNDCYSFKGSATESLLLERATKDSGFAASETSWQGQSHCDEQTEGFLFKEPLWIEFVVVSPQAELAEKKGKIEKTIFKTAEDMCLKAYPINEGKAFIISEKSIPDDKVQEIEDSWNYLRVNIRCYDAI